MANKVLDEVFRTQLSKAQQAFYSTGDISRNLVMMHSIFRDHQLQYLTDLLLMLSLDCSKGYNRVGWCWVKRCLQAARLPEKLQRLLLAFLPGEVHLVFQGVETAGVRFFSGLAQGCPLSCFLFILIVDPFLQYIDKFPGVVGTSGFVDDWAALCKGIGVLARLRQPVDEFEIASGQRINIEKSGIVPSRRLDEMEAVHCRVAWPGIRILYNTRVLGLRIGIEATVEDQYSSAVEKFNRALNDFGALRQRISTVMRIGVINVFLYSLFSFVNRFFYMPVRLLKIVENQILRFLTPIPFSAVGIFSHLKSIYGIHYALRDLRISNIAALLSTYIGDSANQRWLCRSLGRIREDERSLRRYQPLEHPAQSWLVSNAFFLRVVGTDPGDLYEQSLPSPRRRALLDLKLPSKQKVLYAALVEAEEQVWLRYLKHRVEKRGWDGVMFSQGLSSIPPDLTQGQRWHLLKLHLNGHLTYSHLHTAIPLKVPVVEPCPLCGSTPDRIEHYFSCPVVLEAQNTTAAAVPNQVSQPWQLGDVFFQGNPQPLHLHFLLAVFASAWFVRGGCIRGPRPTQDRLVCMVVRGIQFPWLHSGLTLSRKERRKEKIKPPLLHPQHVARYRWDGAFGANEDGQMVGGWGAAFWDNDAMPDGETPDSPDAVASGVCPDPSTNNIAEFFSLRACLQRAVKDPRSRLVFEGDSMLVVNLMEGVWACHRGHLRGLFQNCRDLSDLLEDLGCEVIIRHIYREFNTVADALSKTGLDQALGW